MWTSGTTHSCRRYRACLFPVLAQAIATYGSTDRERTVTTIPAYTGMSMKNRMRYYAYMARQKVLNR